MFQKIMLFLLLFILLPMVPIGAYAQVTDLPTDIQVDLSAGGIQVIFGNILDILIGLVGTLSVIVILWAGILFLTAGASEDRKRAAQAWLKWGVIGIIVSILAFTIISIIGSFLKDILGW